MLAIICVTTLIIYIISSLSTNGSKVIIEDKNDSVLLMQSEIIEIIEQIYPSENIISTDTTQYSITPHKKLISLFNSHKKIPICYIPKFTCWSCIKKYNKIIKEKHSLECFYYFISEDLYVFRDEFAHYTEIPESNMFLIDGTINKKYFSDNKVCIFLLNENMTISNIFYPLSIFPESIDVYLNKVL